MGWLDAALEAGKSFAKDNAGSIAAGVAGAVLGSGTSKGPTGATSSISSVPAWMSDYAQQLLTQANLAASQPYQQYAGPRIAGQTQDQKDAANMVRSNTGQAAGVVQNAMGMLDPNAGKGMLTQAGNYLDGAGGSWLDPGTSGKYMADYRANVTNPAQTQAMRTWNDEINPSIQGTFSGAKGVGAFGSDAMLRTLGGQGSKLTQQLGENMASYLDKGYTQGMSQFNTQNTQQGQLAQIAANLGKTQQDMNQSGVNTQADLAKQWQQLQSNDANALDAIGTREQNLNQGAMDIDFQNWGAQRGYSKEQLDYLQKYLTGLGNSVDKTTTSTTSGTTNTSPLQAATQGLGIYKTLQELGKSPVASSGGSGSGYVDTP